MYFTYLGTEIMKHGKVDANTAKGLLELKKRIEKAQIPPSAKDKTINLATWNIRDFGKKPRLKQSIHYIAEMLSNFDLIAITELRKSLTDLKKVMDILGPHWDVVYSDYVAAELIDEATMARLILDCSGIVCLALTEEKLKQLALPPMVNDNNSKNKTAFTVSIEAKQGVTTGVSAQDRVQTIRTAIADSAKPEHLARPGHVFPLKSENNGVLARRGHTEGSVDLCKLAGLSPCAVLCELMNPNGSMMKGEELVKYAEEHELTLLTIEDIVSVLKQTNNKVA